MEFFNHPDIKKHISLDKYNKLFNSPRKADFDIFSKKFYDQVGMSQDGNSYEDQVVKLILMRYYFCIV